jgi:ATP-binding cassette subfamily B protein
MFNDRTSTTEQSVQKEQTPKISHLARLFMFAFSSTKIISCIYLGAFILLAFLRPLLAFIWGRYIQTVENIAAQDIIIPAVILLVGYYIINIFVGLLDLYVRPYSYYSRLDLVQANRQQEMMHTKMYNKLASLPPEHFEIPKVNDRISQVFGFVSNEMNIGVMMNSYLVIGRMVSVFSIAASLFIFNPWLCLIVLVAPLPTFWSSTKGLKMRFKFVKDNTKLVRKTNYYQGIMLSTAGKELKTLGLHDFFFKKWKEAADEYTIKERSVIRVQTILQMLNYGLLNIVTAFGNVFAIILMAMGSLSLGALGAVMALTSTLVNDMKELIAGVATVYMKKNESAQFFDLMELPEQKADGKICGKINVIHAQNLKYRYPLTERYVLDGINISMSST